MINLMSSRLIFATVVTSFIGLLGSSAIAFQEYPVAEAPRPVDLEDSLVNPNQADADPEIDEDLQVLMRGPIHEAFAESYLADPVPSPLIQQAPPADIAELPPEYKPDGNNVQWIPGYWAWDPIARRFHLDQWRLARCPAKSPMGQRLLGVVSRGIPLDLRFLGGRVFPGTGILARAATKSRKRTFFTASR